MAYAWTITEDLVTKGADNGVCGPSKCTMTPDDIKEKGTQFKMYDADGKLHYIGYITGDYDGLEPLDDFGKPNSGCTEIRYNGKKL